MQVYEGSMLSISQSLAFFSEGGYDGNDHRAAAAAAVYTGKQSFLFVFLRLD